MEKVVATTATKASNPAVRNTDDETATGTMWTVRARPSAKLRQVVDDEKLSNAVEPSSTASTATTPGRIGSDTRWSKGLPMPIFRVVTSRRKGDNRDTAMLYTPNGSARANQRCPHNHAPINRTRK